VERRIRERMEEIRKRRAQTAGRSSERDKKES
jgi:hypothetical protein